MSLGRVIWAYDREHTLHPFIVLGLKTLAEAGWDATMVSSDLAPAGAAWRSLDGFSFEDRQRRYTHLAFTVRNRWEQAAVRRVHARQDLQKQLGRDGESLSRSRQAGIRRRMAWLDVQVQAIMAARVVLKDYAGLKRLTWDTWMVYLRGFLQLAGLKAEVMIASRPEAALWALIVAKAKGMRFVYFPFELYGDQLARPNPVLAVFERMMLRYGVDAVITQNERRAEVLETERGSRVKPLIVHNYKPIHAEDRPKGRLREKIGVGPDKRIVLHEGMIIDGRWLEFVAQATLHLPQDVVMVFLGQEKLKWRQVHAAEIAAPLATGRFFVEKPVAHDELHDYVADADVGVIIYDDSVRNNVFCEPGKLSDYIAVGVPVVAPNFPTIGPVMAQYDIGRCFDGHSPQAIAATIMSVLERPRAEWAPALRRACSELTWETQAPNLLAAVGGGQPSSNSAACVQPGGTADGLGAASTAT